MKAIRIVSVGPLRCLATMSSARPSRSGSSFLYTSSRKMKATTSASCSMEPDSRRSESCGRWLPRPPAAGSTLRCVTTGRRSWMARIHCHLSRRLSRFNRQEYFTRKREDKMIQRLTPGFKRMALALTVAISAGLLSTAASAQNQQMEQKLMAIKDAQAANKQKLAQYTWQETETISIKGDVKDTKVYQVSMVNGQQQKTEISNQAAQSGGREGRLKERVVDKKKQEYQEYGQSIGALAKQYTTPNPEALMQAKQAGNISLQPGSGTV